jgi:acetolactate synthase I/II/III large subunit
MTPAQDTAGPKARDFPSADPAAAEITAIDPLSRCRGQVEKWRIAPCTKAGRDVARAESRKTSALVRIWHSDGAADRSANAGTTFWFRVAELIAPECGSGQVAQTNLPDGSREIRADQALRFGAPEDMRAKNNSRTAAEMLVDQLVVNGVRHVFCVPGESYLAVLDAFPDRDLEVTVCRNEGGAAMMAEAVGKATGRPGICFVTRGPGATNASPGIHIARQDSTPLIMFVGQVARDMREREAFQELDYRAVFGTMAKWVTEIDDPARVSEIVSRAFYTATNGRPGPVVIALPEDMLTEHVSMPDAPAFEPVEMSPGPLEMQKLATLISQAERPILILGGSRWSAEASSSLQHFAERHSLPVATTFRRAHLFDALHPCYAGDLGIGPNPKLLARIKSADLVMLVGGRLGELPSQSYTLFDIPGPQTTFVHVHPGSEELGRVYRPHLAINAAPTGFAAALNGLKVESKTSWSADTATMHAEYLAWSEAATKVPGPVNLGEVMVWLRENLPADTILCNGAGNYAAWIHRFYRFRRFASQIAPTSGSMGYGVPAAIAMKRFFPDRPVVAVAGDGDFLMNGQEFATAVQFNLPVVIVIADNGTYGTIRMHQEREYPGRVSATELKNPDFVAYAQAFGGFGAAVRKTSDFAEAFKAASASGKPAIIHLKIDPEAITPATTLSSIRDKALAARGNQGFSKPESAPVGGRPRDPFVASCAES